MKNKVLFILGIIILVLIYYFYYSDHANKIVYEDKNQNEIWDDAEPFIKENANTEDERKALEYMFKTYQKILLNPENALKFKDSHGPTDFGKAFTCLYSVYSKYFPDDNDPQSIILSSWARHRAWAKYNANLSGGIYHTWQRERDGEPCPFKDNVNSQ